MSLPTDDMFLRECSHKFNSIRVEWLDPRPHYVQRWDRMIQWLNKKEKEYEVKNEETNKESRQPAD